jgi:hypothetical protein
VNAQYDYKFVGLINDSIKEKLLKKDFVDDIVFVLISDIRLNGKRVTAALVSDIDKANMTLYNPSMLISGTSGTFEKGGVVVDETFARELRLDIGDKVVVSPVYKDYNLDLKVTGIAQSPIHTVKVVMEYPEVFKEYFRSKLPNSATYGEAYIKFKNGDKRSYAKSLAGLTNEKKVVLRSDKVKKLSEYYEKEFSSLPVLISIYSGFTLFMLLLVRESVIYAKRNNRIYKKLKKFSYSSRLLLQHFLCISSNTVFSTILAILYWIVFSKLFLGVFNFSSLLTLSIMPIALLVSMMVFYGMIRVG